MHMTSVRVRYNYIPVGAAGYEEEPDAETPEPETDELREKIEEEGGVRMSVKVAILEYLGFEVHA